eukprot:snap_masked-scaffold_11-processed-gene-8.17-mRNA-1 protein AED:1.00 eAED:1.00 QI:0/-1/0/0/-1/1/1/0/220
MFVVEKIDDIIQIHPTHFNQAKDVVLKRLIEKKYCNKVVAGHGLVISLFDIQSADEGKVHAETYDGTVHVNSEFRLSLFRPLKQELIVGTVKYCLSTFVKITVEFFDDIIVYADMLPQPIKYIEGDQMFKWMYNSEEEEDSDDGFFIASGSMVRLRVEDVKFDHDLVYSKQDWEIHSRFKAMKGVAGDELRTVRKNMVVLGRMNEMGLGPLSWWEDDDEE